jgi:hypothetical protein
LPFFLPFFFYIGCFPILSEIDSDGNIACPKDDSCPNYDPSLVAKKLNNYTNQKAYTFKYRLDFYFSQ